MRSSNLQVVKVVKDRLRRVLRLTPVATGTAQVTATFLTDTLAPTCVAGGLQSELTALLPVTVTEPGVITVESPNGGEDWPIGSAHLIRWSS